MWPSVVHEDAELVKVVGVAAHGEVARNFDWPTLRVDGNDRARAVFWQWLRRLRRHYS